MDKSVLWAFRGGQGLCSLRLLHLLPSVTAVDSVATLPSLSSQKLSSHPRILSFPHVPQSICHQVLLILCPKYTSTLSTFLHLQSSLSCHHFSPGWPQWPFNSFPFLHSCTTLHSLRKLKWDHVTPLLRILPWLHIAVRIKFIFLMLAPVCTPWLWSGFCLPL